MPRQLPKRDDPDYASKSLQFIGENLLDHIIGNATIALLKAGTPVTPKSLSEIIKGENDMAKDVYLPAQEFLASLPEPSADE